MWVWLTKHEEAVTGACSQRSLTELHKSSHLLAGVVVIRQDEMRVVPIQVGALDDLTVVALLLEAIDVGP